MMCILSKDHEEWGSQKEIERNKSHYICLLNYPYYKFQRLNVWLEYVSQMPIG